MPELSAEQLNAKKTIQEEDFVFLTGQAGTGKSEIIRSLKRDYGDECCVTATGGLSAQLIRGGTIHSFIGWKFISPGHPGELLPYPVFNDRVRDCKLLIIDEVSMMSSGLLDLLFQRFARARYTPKVVLVGDLLQLGPVEHQENVNNYPYMSRHWSKFHVLKLKENHRQSELDFIKALNDIRVGIKSQEAMDLIKSRTVDSLPIDSTRLFALKREVEAVNSSQLRDLAGDTRRSLWEIEYKTKNAKNSEPKSRFQETLLLKTGARVAFLNNDPDKEWVNGTTGAVTDIKPGQVTVELETGRKVQVGKTEEEIFDIYGSVTHVVRQYPLMLSWALTIHKAQGMTLSKVGVSLNGHFAPGQTYTALSRCKTKNGLHLVGLLNQILVDENSLAICG